MTDSDVKSIEQKVERLWDIQAIESVLKAYCRGFDRRDLDVAKTTHWPDAIVDYANICGSAYDMADDADRVHETQFDSTSHYITNNMIDVSGDVAHSETYFIMAGRPKDSARTVLIGGRYLRRLDRRDGEWRIATAVCTVDWSSDEETASQLLRVAPLSARDRSDWVYQRPLEIRGEKRSSDLSLAGQ